MSSSIRDFAHRMCSVGQLKRQLDEGKLSRATVEQRLKELMIQDEAGNWWMIGFQSGKWYQNLKGQWVEAVPPHRPAPSGEAALPGPPFIGADRIWFPTLLTALGWSMGFAWIPGILDTVWFGEEWLVVLVGVIGGLTLAGVLWWIEPTIQGKQVPLVAMAWTVAAVILLGLEVRRWIGHPSFAGELFWCLFGAIGGLGTALILRWAQPSLRRAQVATISMGWAAAWGIFGLTIPWAMLRGEGGMGVFDWTLTAAIAGAVGGALTFSQIRLAKHDSESRL